MNNNETGQAANPMSAFVGVDFDCVIENSLGQGVTFYLDYDTLNLVTNQKGKLSPRLNKAQVLDDYTPILVDGFVWEHSTDYPSFAMTPLSGKVTSAAIKMMNDSREFKIHWIKFIGVGANKGLDAWAEANDVPVMTL